MQIIGQQQQLLRDLQGKEDRLSLFLAFFLTHTNNKIESDTHTLIDTLTHTHSENNSFKNGRK